MKTRNRISTAVAVLLVVVSLVRGQSPIMTESALTSGKGILTPGLGFEYLAKSVAPSQNAPQTLLRVLLAGLHQGVAENVNFDLQWRGGLFSQWGNGKRYFDWGDLSVWTKITFFKEKDGIPSFGIRTGVKLPNTRYVPSRLGSNQTDFHSQVLVSRRLTSVELRGNFTFSIVGDPNSAGFQDDIYSAQFAALLQITDHDRMFVELHGRTGYQDHDDKAVVRAGFVVEETFLTWTLYGSARLAGNSRDFGTAFDCSETWGVGLFLQKNIVVDF